MKYYYLTIFYRYIFFVPTKAINYRGQNHRKSVFNCVISKTSVGEKK